EARSLPVSLQDLSFDRLESKSAACPPPWNLRDLLVRAEQAMTTSRPKQSATALNLSGDAERLRWFALPQP
ncbi:MAG: hypothetical protein P8N17_00385, partial [Luminiphilus sp.]|nr:hypothetical protein [Luminiphilus sp.]